MGFEVSAEARERYLKRRVQDLAVLHRAIADQNFLQMQEVAHQLKGNGVTFGFPELSECALRLETAAKAQDLAAAEKEVQRMDEWLTLQSVTKA